MSKKIQIFSDAGFTCVLGTILGVGLGVLYSFGGLLYDLITTSTVNTGTALAFFALLGMPILFGVIGFLIGLIGSAINSLFNK